MFLIELLSLIVVNLIFPNYSFACMFSLDIIYLLGCSFLSFLYLPYISHVNSVFSVKDQIIYNLFHISSQPHFFILLFKKRGEVRKRINVTVSHCLFKIIQCCFIEICMFVCNYVYVDMYICMLGGGSMSLYVCACSPLCFNI